MQWLQITCVFVDKLLENVTVGVLSDIFWEQEVSGHPDLQFYGEKKLTK